MSTNAEFQTFTAEAIRDTNTHNGSTLDMRGLKIKTIIVENGLDQSVTLQFQASANSDFSNNFNVGSPFVVTNATNTYQTSDSYFPFVRLSASCTISPTSGALDVILIGTD